MLQRRNKCLVSLCSLILLITTGNTLAKSKSDPQPPQPDTVEFIVEDEITGL